MDVESVKFRIMEYVNLVELFFVQHALLIKVNVQCVPKILILSTQQYLHKAVFAIPVFIVLIFNVFNVLLDV